ncbi:hypothetical protein BSM4216_3695 [Bacillus smithii]|nr:hypothetical protein BSM4216_3695 [Bacillus smithii]
MMVNRTSVQKLVSRFCTEVLFFWIAFKQSISTIMDYFSFLSEWAIHPFRKVADKRME